MPVNPLKTKRLVVNVPASMAEELEALASSEDRTVPNYIFRVLGRHLMGLGTVKERQDFVDRWKAERDSES